MKKISIIFILLLSTFFIAWGIKLKTPINRPDNVEDEAEVPWYESRYTSPIADAEWTLDPSVPDNYVPVPGEDELYMVVDTSGTITAYRKRTLQSDGTWAWEDVNPDVPDNYELVDEANNLYKVTESNGEISYFLYVRNEDDTYCFVPSDEKGNPYYDGEDAEVIASNYVHEDENVYSVYNHNGVKEGYGERKQNKDGSYTWKKSNKPNKKKNNTNLAQNSTENTTQSDKKVISGESDTGTETVQNGDGTYTVTEKEQNTVTEDGYEVVYETTVYNTYNSNGTLISTKQVGPFIVSKTKSEASATPNKDLIKDSLDDEYNRVAALVTYDTKKANEVLTKLNAERQKKKLNTLTMDTNSESYKLACIRAADMAIYNYSASESPMYGTLDDMVSKWKCSTSNASENIWKAGNKSAEDIHKRLQAYDGSREVRMSDSYSSVGIAIVEKDGQTYIAEIYLK